MRRYSQVFLTDTRYIEKIISAITSQGLPILEIGPGKGAITAGLLHKTHLLVCVDIDKKLCDNLRQSLKNYSYVRVENKSILRFSLSDFNEKIVIVGNIPYHISKEIIKYFFKNRQFINTVYITCQSEFADKLMAKPSSSAYCALSCYAQYCANITKLFDIPALAFSPIPRVSSAFVKLDFYSQSPWEETDQKMFFNLINQAFCGRRKQIINALSNFFSDEKIFAQLGISPFVRPENLSLKDYVKLANSLTNKKIKET